MKKNIFIIIVILGFGYIGFKVFINKTESQTTKNLKETTEPSLTGVWVKEQDHLSSLTITDSTLTYAYEGALPTGSDHFKYTIIKSEIEEFRNVIRIVNPLDTLQYEILVHNDTLLHLMDYQNGVIDAYVLKK